MTEHGCLRGRGLIFVCLSAALIVCGGCNMSVPLHYAPLPAADALAEPGERPASVYVVTFADSREDKEKIGSLRNAFGVQARGIVTSSDVPAIFAEACTDALNKAQLKASLHSDRKTGETIPAPELKGYDAVVGGTIRRIEVYVQPKFINVDAVATVEIELSVTKGGKTETVGPIEGTSRKEIPMVTYEDISTVTNLAMQNCMRNMIRHLRASGALK